MTEDKEPTIYRSADDPLGYDTRRPFHEWAREMAEDALAGRHQEAIDAEIERFRKRWGMPK